MTMEYRKEPWDPRRMAIVVSIAIVVILSTMGLLFLSVAGDFISEASIHGEHYSLVEVSGNSMYPHMQDGDQAVMMKTSYPSFSITVGDIIVYWFEPEDIYVAHRVIYITNADSDRPHYHVMGDNNPTIDVDFVTPDLIAGKVVRVADNLFEKWCYNVVL